ncbi:MAG: HEPN domain-containing protein [Acidobacteria bacterium]|nr:HEPN domain-containing protein [Acidobacteriota bacterium]
MNRKRQSALFVIGDGSDSVVMNWVGTPQEKLEFYAEAYHQAGRRLADEFGTMGNVPEFEASPIVYLYRHSLELYLKAILVPGDQLLRLSGKPGLDPKLLFGTHDLTVLLPGLKAVGEEMKWGWDMGIDGLRSYQDFVELIEELDRIDKSSFSFRYPMDKRGDSTLPEQFTFSLRNFCSRMDALLRVLDGDVTGVELALQDEAEMRQFHP